MAETWNDGLHDDFVITSLMMTVGPTSVRYEQRVAADHASINSVSIHPRRALAAAQPRRTAVAGG